MANNDEVVNEGLAKVDVTVVEGDKLPDTSKSNMSVFQGDTNVSYLGTAKVDENGNPINGLGQKSTIEFSKIAEEWSSKQPKVVDFNDNIQAEATGKRDIVIQTDEAIIGSSGGDITINGHAMTANANVGMTRITRIPTTVAGYLYEEGQTDPESLRQLVYQQNRGLQKRIERIEEREISEAYGMTFKGQKPSKVLNLRLNKDICRAVLTGKYNTINNDEIMNIVMNNLPTGSADTALASHSSSDGDSMSLNVLIPDRFSYVKGDSDYGMGVNIANNEIGEGTFKVSGFLYRIMCRNGCIHGKLTQVSVNKKHIGVYTSDDIVKILNTAFDAVLTHGHLFLKQMMMTKEYKIDYSEIAACIAYVGESNNIPYNAIVKWGEGWKTEANDNPELAESAFGVIQSITRGSQAFTGADRQVQETVAGSMLSPSLDATLPEIMNWWQGIESASKRTLPSLVEKVKLAIG